MPIIKGKQVKRGKDIYVYGEDGHIYKRFKRYDYIFAIISKNRKYYIVRLIGKLLKKILPNNLLGI